MHIKKASFQDLKRGFLDLVPSLRTDIYTKNKYILILQLIILKRKAFCQFFYCKFNKTTYCTIRWCFKKYAGIKRIHY